MAGVNERYQVFIIIVFMCILENVCVKLPDTLQTKYEEEVSVELEDLVYSSHNRDRRSSAMFPESFSLRFHIKEESVYLALTRNKRLSTNIPTYVEENGVIILHQPTVSTECGFYQDQSHMASITMECSRVVNNKCVFKVHGSLVHNGEHYIVEESTEVRDENKPSYRVLQPEASADLGNDYVHIQDFHQQSEESHTRRRRATGNYKVELLLVADYSVYKFWYDQSSASTPQDKRNYAINTIRRVYASLLNGMDVRYSNLPGYSVTINYAGISIAETPSASSFVESLKFSTSPVKLDANHTLWSFNTWIGQNQNQLPKHDHAMLFTKYDVTLNSNSDATGYAFLKGICTDKSQSVVEENFNFLTQTIAAHELAHSLGAVHDGDDNSCQRNAKYIMSTKVSATQGASAYHPWEFSSCSKNEMSSHIDTIPNNCMLTQTSNENPNGLDQYLAPNIGQTFSADKQCELSVGTGSYVCREPYNGTYTSVCTGLWCLDVDSPSNECVLIIPGMGTTCGDKKWCINGTCVNSNEAPSAVGTCVFGDMPGSYSNGQTCQQIVALTPWQCYGSIFNKLCCESCGRIYNATRTDCPYGDRADCSQVTWGFPCYGNERSCCGTCAKYKTQIQGCVYGDKAQGCVRQSCTRYTVADYTSCCETCYNVLTTQPGSGSSTIGSGSTTAAPGPSSSLPTWVIPAAAGGGGALLLIIIIIACYCGCRNSSPNEEKILKSLQNRNFSNLNQPYSQGARAPNPYSYANSPYIQPDAYKSQPANPYNRQRPPAPRGNVRADIPRANIVDRGASVKSNAPSEHVYMDIVPPTTYQGLQNRQGQGHNYTSVGQADQYRRGQDYTNSAYIHPR